jgi:hypothetical protein
VQLQCSGGSSSKLFAGVGSGPVACCGGDVGWCLAASILVSHLLSSGAVTQYLCPPLPLPSVCLQANATVSGALATQALRTVSTVVTSGQDVISSRSETAARGVVNSVRISGDVSLARSMLSIAAQVLSSSEERSVGPNGRRLQAGSDTGQYVHTCTTWVE